MSRAKKTTPQRVAWADVPPGSVAWDASTADNCGGDPHASVAVRFPALDAKGRDGAWAIVWGNPSTGSSGGWVGPNGWTAPHEDVQPLEPEFMWGADTFALCAEDGTVEIIASGLTVDDCASIGAMTPEQVREWATARKDKAT